MVVFLLNTVRYSICLRTAMLYFGGTSYTEEELISSGPQVGA